MLRKISLKFLQNKLKEKNIEIVIFKDNTFQALKQVAENKYYVVSRPCKNLKELRKDLKKRAKNEKVFY